MQHFLAGTFVHPAPILRIANMPLVMNRPAAKAKLPGALYCLCMPSELSPSAAHAVRLRDFVHLADAALWGAAFPLKFHEACRLSTMLHGRPVVRETLSFQANPANSSRIPELVPSRKHAVSGSFSFGRTFARLGWNTLSKN